MTSDLLKLAMEVFPKERLDYIEHVKEWVASEKVSKKFPDLKHFMQFKEIDEEVITSCILDMAYLDDFVINRFNSLPIKELPNFRAFIYELAKALNEEFPKD